MAGVRRRHQVDAVRKQRHGHLGSRRDTVSRRHVRGNLERERRVRARYVEGHADISAEDDDVAGGAAYRILPLAARGTFAAMHHDVRLRNHPFDPVARRKPGFQRAFDVLPPSSSCLETTPVKTFRWSRRRATTALAG